MNDFSFKIQKLTCKERVCLPWFYHANHAISRLIWDISRISLSFNSSWSWRSLSRMELSIVKVTLSEWALAVLLPLMLSYDVLSLVAASGWPVEGIVSLWIVVVSGWQRAVRHCVEILIASRHIWIALTSHTTNSGVEWLLGFSELGVGSWRLISPNRCPSLNHRASQRTLKSWITLTNHDLVSFIFVNLVRVWADNRRWNDQSSCWVAEANYLTEGLNLECEGEGVEHFLYAHIFGN